MEFTPKSNFPLTLQERKQIKQFIDLEYSCGRIAQAIKRSKNAIVTEIRRNGGKENYDPIKAHNSYNQRKDVKYDKLRSRNIEDHPMTRIKNKIDALEMQLNILIDLVRDLQNKVK